jgi:hypothetical protein
MNHQCKGYAGDPGASAPRCEGYLDHPGRHYIRPIQPPIGLPEGYDQRVTDPDPCNLRRPRSECWIHMDHELQLGVF